MGTLKSFLGKVLGPAALLALAGTFDAAAQTTTIRIAEADSLSGEDLIQLIAYENAKARGVEVEVILLKSDDITFQAVLNGEADVGVGVAYTPLQTLSAPIRHFYQVRRLAYFPVVDAAKYQTWADLDGEAMAVHSRGSGTEAMARLMEKEHGIEFGQITYVPGSEVRIGAMQRGTMSATLLDLPSTQLLTAENPDRFRVLPLGDIAASDSAYYATTAFLEENAEAVQILTEELIKAARAAEADPAWPAAERERLGLLEDLPPELVDDITTYHTQAKEANLFPTDGGGEEAARADLEFLSESGSLQGEAGSLNVEDFWDLRPLNAALEAVGAQ